MSINWDRYFLKDKVYLEKSSKVNEFHQTSEGSLYLYNPNAKRSIDEYNEMFTNIKEAFEQGWKIYERNE